MKKISKSFYFAVIFIFLSLKHSESQQLTNLNNNNDPIEIFADNGIEWHKNKNKYVAFPVVKKLPVLLIGKISTINKNIKGII